MPYVATILSAAKSLSMSGSLLLAICAHETGLRNIEIHSDGGSPTYGICQVKYETAKMVGFTGKEKDLMVPAINARYAAKYLKFQFDRYDGDWCKAVAAYNAGRFNESFIYPGYPRNLKYVRRVQKKLDQNLKSRLSCDKKVARK